MDPRKEELAQFIEEAINLEHNLSRLYGVYAQHSPEDFGFWTKLETEEKNHAALLNTGKEFLEHDRFPRTLLPGSVEEIQKANATIERIIDEFIVSPDRALAFEQALKLEKSAGEMHYQYFMEEDSDDELVKIFQNLNRADKNHAERIFLYWQQSM